MKTLEQQWLERRRRNTESLIRFAAQVLTLKPKDFKKKMQ
jgi:hypothetical protein